MPGPTITASQLENPQVTIYVKALGVLCFNHDSSRAEIGFLKVKKDNGRDDHDLLAAFFGDPPPEIPSCPHKIAGDQNFIGSGGSLEVYQNECSSENFNRLINLADIYGPDIDFKDETQFVAKMFIENAVFSVDGPSFVRATPFPISGTGQPKPTIEIARTIKIETKGKTDHIIINGESVALDPDKFYKIVLDSDCHSAEGDFKLFYEILDGAGDTQYNLRFEEAGRLFAGGQDAELGELLANLAEFLKHEAIPADADAHDKQISRMLEILGCLKGALCEPAACCPSRIDGKSLSLP